MLCNDRNKNIATKDIKLALQEVPPNNPVYTSTIFNNVKMRNLLEKIGFINIDAKDWDDEVVYKLEGDKMLCQVCGRETPEDRLERHHLIPKCKKGKETIDVCIDCGNQLHQLFTIKQMEYTYNTLEEILANDKVKTWIKWISKKKDFGSVCMKIKKRT